MFYVSKTKGFDVKNNSTKANSKNKKNTQNTQKHTQDKGLYIIIWNYNAKLYLNIIIQYFNFIL